MSFLRASRRSQVLLRRHVFEVLTVDCDRSVGTESGRTRESRLGDRPPVGDA
jgi:hypothetical protein